MGHSAGRHTRYIQLMALGRIEAYLKGVRKTFGEINQSIAASTNVRSSESHVIIPKLQDENFGELDVLPEYREVKELLEKSFPLIFVTGGAGTGKSTFVRWLDNEFRGKTLLCAPTGIAALTIAGKTIHSLCRLPPSWIVDSDIKSHPRSLAKHAQILIIDEISMVNANQLDAMDSFFRLNRGNTKPFGGISVVLVGDLFQLPPIVSSTIEHLFSANYKTPKFFSANAIAQSEFHVIELTKTFRQVDQSFADLLSDIREGKNIQETLESLNTSCKIATDPDAGTISLSPRHADVERINNDRLGRLSGKVAIFQGKTTGQFRERQLPVPISIELKVDAQVMLAKNARGSNDYVNGDIGTISEIFGDRVKVMLIRSQKIVEVPIDLWEQFDYKFNNETKKIEREVVGTYFQLPVILGWAITIHRSQGLTLERVHIDLGKGAFESGQTYVALSRCRSIATLSLARPVRAGDIRVDPQATAFYAEICR